MNLIYTVNTLKEKYTTHKPSVFDGWDFREYVKVENYFNPLGASRFYKILNREPKEYKKTLYYDTKFKPNFDYAEWASHFQDYDLVVMRHNKRDCVYDEIQFCINLDIFNNEILNKQLDYLNKIRFPKNVGLWAPGIMIRKNNKAIRKFNIMWWNYFDLFPCRDQISLAMAIYNNKKSDHPIKIKALDFKETYNLFMGR